MDLSAFVEHPPTQHRCRLVKHLWREEELSLKKMLRCCANFSLGLIVYLAEELLVIDWEWKYWIIYYSDSSFGIILTSITVLIINADMAHCWWLINNQHPLQMAWQCLQNQSFLRSSHPTLMDIYCVPGSPFQFRMNLTVFFVYLLSSGSLAEINPCSRLINYNWKHGGEITSPSAPAEKQYNPNRIYRPFNCQMSTVFSVLGVIIDCHFLGRATNNSSISIAFLSHTTENTSVIKSPAHIISFWRL